MSSLTAGKHAGSGAAQPAIAEPTFAERARTLVYLVRVSRLSRHDEWAPRIHNQGLRFGSLSSFVSNYSVRPWEPKVTLTQGG